RPCALHGPGRGRRAGGAGRTSARVVVARLWHAVLRHFSAVWRRLLQDRSSAIQSGGGMAHQCDYWTYVPRRRVESRRAGAIVSVVAQPSPELLMTRMPSFVVLSLVAAAA